MTDCSLRLTDVPSLLTTDTEDGFISQLKALWQNKSILTGTFSKLPGNKGVPRLYPALFPTPPRGAWRLLGAPSSVLVNRAIHHLMGCVSILKLKMVSHSPRPQEQHRAHTHLSSSPACKLCNKSCTFGNDQQGHQHLLPKQTHSTLNLMLTEYKYLLFF